MIKRNLSFIFLYWLYFFLSSRNKEQLLTDATCIGSRYRVFSAWLGALRTFDLPNPSWLIIWLSGNISNPTKWVFRIFSMRLSVHLTIKIMSMMYLLGESRHFSCLHVQLPSDINNCVFDHGFCQIQAYHHTLRPLRHSYIFHDDIWKNSVDISDPRVLSRPIFVHRGGILHLHIC